MIREAIIAAVLAVVGVIGMGQETHALGLKVAPLEYKTTLKTDERKQGVIDVSNPSSQAVKIAVSVQAFKQIDDDGGLQFYDDKPISAAIKPELQELDLGPKEAIRLSFAIDGKLLPEGDVYAAILFTTQPSRMLSGVGQQVRVGTLLSVVNKAPGSRQAEVTNFNLPLLQLTGSPKGEYRIKNTGPAGTGFYPTVTVKAWPNGKARQIEGSLIFGGRERSNDFTYETGYGIHKIGVTYGGSTVSRWVITIAPWMIVLFLLIVLVIGIEILLLKRRRKTLHKI